MREPAAGFGWGAAGGCGGPAFCAGFAGKAAGGFAIGLMSGLATGFISGFANEFNSGPGAGLTSCRAADLATTGSTLGGGGMGWAGGCPFAAPRRSTGTGRGDFGGVLPGSGDRGASGVGLPGLAPAICARK